MRVFVQLSDWGGQAQLRATPGALCVCVFFVFATKSWSLAPTHVSFTGSCEWLKCTFHWCLCVCLCLSVFRSHVCPLYKHTHAAPRVYMIVFITVYVCVCVCMYVCVCVCNTFP